MVSAPVAMISEPPFRPSGKGKQRRFTYDTIERAVFLQYSQKIFCIFFWNAFALENKSCVT